MNPFHLSSTDKKQRTRITHPRSEIISHIRRHQPWRKQGKGNASSSLRFFFFYLTKGTDKRHRNRQYQHIEGTEKKKIVWQELFLGVCDIDI